MKLNKLHAEVGKLKRVPSLCFFDFAFPKEKAVVNYENNYIAHYYCNSVLGFGVRIAGLWKYNIGGKEYGLWYFYDDR